MGGDAFHAAAHLIMRSLQHAVTEPAALTNFSLLLMFRRRAMGPCLRYAWMSAAPFLSTVTMRSMTAFVASSILTRRNIGR